ncbi:MAG: hypothetical protein ACJ71S_06385 [Acidobacteriaceae bacterium]
MRPKKKVFLYHPRSRDAALLRFVLQIRMHVIVHMADSVEDLYVRSAGMDALIHCRGTATEIVRYDETSQFFPRDFPVVDLLEALRLSLARRRGPTTSRIVERYKAKRAYMRHRVAA